MGDVWENKIRQMVKEAFFWHPNSSLKRWQFSVYIDPYSVDRWYKHIYWTVSLKMNKDCLVFYVFGL